MQPQVTEKKPLLNVKGLKKYFPVKTPLGRTVEHVKAVNDVSFKLFEGETYGLVGESGCGKSTTGRTILGLDNPTEGELLYKDQNILDDPKKSFVKLKKDFQMVFQDPFSSLNPRQRIGSILEEPLIIHNIASKQKRMDMVMEILHKVGLSSDNYYHYPHEFSGGQRQRIGIARALIINPKIIICDEPVSALDVSTQSQIINLMQELQKEYKLTYLFIAHDISVVRHISDRIGVMYLGKIVEEAETEDLISNPSHPYSQALLSAVPLPEPSIKKERIILKGDIPSPLNPPSGCFFHTRCPIAEDICSEKVPVRKEIRPNHFVSCHLVD
ncbi:peptide/nickel transport system ATP-binding protein/oligopeptide transport system ATP-binding protein [Lentibacillus persicus]|uniref:Peptide/nickel transport system ATP-binding protein/oligopeptide transport system ATP-binding protein n=1 Tax=Lentibacillus persicus TaxID=640948 RepID=A0A1I1VY60_9BACI|nr:dipeptide ABC transporter ATP-binding protein [Lentibacillus persicus]SFD87907.1 peptide/nickel transport system ATP-binding protein/oligopeptide transport system ATP-binding protein [Lentibacillus persicus]